MVSRLPGARPMPDWKFRAWNVWAHVKHIAGLHTFIDLEEWNSDDGSIQVIGRICWVCEERE
jgi:hypothetical protein